jgi:hypothetical protein
MVLEAAAGHVLVDEHAVVVLVAEAQQLDQVLVAQHPLQLQVPHLRLIRSITKLIHKRSSSACTWLWIEVNLAPN